MRVRRVQERRQSSAQGRTRSTPALGCCDRAPHPRTESGAAETPTQKPSVRPDPSLFSAAVPHVCPPLLPSTPASDASDRAARRPLLSPQQQTQPLKLVFTSNGGETSHRPQATHLHRRSRCLATITASPQNVSITPKLRPCGPAVGGPQLTR